MSDDISAQISSILNDPESLAALQQMASSFMASSDKNQQSGNTQANGQTNFENNTGHGSQAANNTGGFGSGQPNSTAARQNNSNQGGTDIGGILQALQSNPQMLNGILNSLGATGNQGGGNPLQGGNQANNLGALAGLGNLGNLAPGGTQNPLSALAGLGDIGAIAKILKALNSNVCDDRAALLNALKPHLCEKRRQRVDKAVKMLRLVSLLPLLREQGILNL